MHISTESERIRVQNCTQMQTLNEIRSRCYLQLLKRFAALRASDDRARAACACACRVRVRVGECASESLE